jgi:predicted Zn-dependent protease
MNTRSAGQLGFRIAAVAAASLLCGGCRGGSAAEWLAGRQATEVRVAGEVEARYGGLWRNESAAARLVRVAGQIVKVVPDLPCTCSFQLLDSEECNAVSLSPGRIYLTRGLYQQLVADDLVAAAVAHELAHVVCRDGFKPAGDEQTRLARESAADLRGAGFLAAAGFDPRAMADLVRMVQDGQPGGWARRRVQALAVYASRPAGQPVPRTPQTRTGQP